MIRENDVSRRYGTRAIDDGRGDDGAIRPLTVEIYRNDKKPSGCRPPGRRFHYHRYNSHHSHAMSTDRPPHLSVTRCRARSCHMRSYYAATLIIEPMSYTPICRRRHGVEIELTPPLCIIPGTRVVKASTTTLSARHVPKIITLNRNTLRHGRRPLVA